ncbi:hypothetical protein BGW38_001557 [Lunasporangiospora selenospora]|uniref:Uncharacterized protein n=1 Tax=Lunasporangiospora selenospora TaxID=979761 RepID=A0A9P6KIV4_9FUNG|nr:hypothetical protein BGW38_001557 [Lunasporangiospora selenospora]
MAEGLFIALGIFALLLALKIIIVIIILRGNHKNKDTPHEDDPQLHNMDLAQMPLPDHSQEQTFARGLDVCIAMDEITSCRERSPITIAIQDEHMKVRRSGHSQDVTSVVPRPSTESFAGVGSPVQIIPFEPNTDRHLLVPMPLTMPSPSPKMSAFEPSLQPSPEPSRAPSPLGSMVDEAIETDETKSDMLSTKPLEPAEAQPRRSVTI